MPAIGDVYHLTDHQHLTVTELGDDVLVVEALWDPHVPRPPHEPPPHRHRAQAEHFVVHEGELTARIEGAERVLRPGDVLDVPAGTVHAMWSTADGPSRATWEVRPPLRTAQLWAALTALRAGPPETLAQEGPALLAEYAQEFELVLGEG